MRTLKELLEKCDTQLKQSDVREQAAECEAILQRTWEHRIGLHPLRIHQNIGNLITESCTSTRSRPLSGVQANTGGISCCCSCCTNRLPHMLVTNSCKGHASCIVQAASQALVVLCGRAG